LSGSDADQYRPRTRGFSALTGAVL